MQDASRSVFIGGCLFKADGNEDTADMGAIAHISPRFVLGFVFHIARSQTEAVAAHNCRHHGEPEGNKRQPKQAPVHIARSQIEAGEAHNCRPQGEPKRALPTDRAVAIAGTAKVQAQIQTH